MQILGQVALAVAAAWWARWLALSGLVLPLFNMRPKVYDPQRALIAGIVIGVALVVRGAILFTSQGSRSTSTSFGLAGGAICPRCGRPFALSLLSPHFAGLRFSRCPHCGKWSMVGRAHPEDLAAAERQDTPDINVPAPVKEDADALRRQIEDSRYQ